MQNRGALAANPGLIRSTHKRELVYTPFSQVLSIG